MSFIGLANNILTGAIPGPLLLLPKLEFLYHNNNIDSTIPASFGVSGSLTDLWLNNNRLSGTIPTVSNFTNITELLLQENDLTGEMPASICEIRASKPIQFFNLFVDCNEPAEVTCTCCNACF